MLRDEREVRWIFRPCWLPRACAGVTVTVPASGSVGGSQLEAGGDEDSNPNANRGARALLFPRCFRLVPIMSVCERVGPCTVAVCAHSLMLSSYFSHEPNLSCVGCCIMVFCLCVCVDLL